MKHSGWYDFCFIFLLKIAGDFAFSHCSSFAGASNGLALVKNGDDVKPVVVSSGTVALPDHLTTCPPASADEITETMMTMKKDAIIGTLRALDLKFNRKSMPKASMVRLVNEKMDMLRAQVVSKAPKASPSSGCGYVSDEPTDEVEEKQGTDDANEGGDGSEEGSDGSYKVDADFDDSFLYFPDVLCEEETTQGLEEEKHKVILKTKCGSHKISLYSGHLRQ